MTTRNKGQYQLTSNSRNLGSFRSLQAAIAAAMRVGQTWADVAVWDGEELLACVVSGEQVCLTGRYTTTDGDALDLDALENDHCEPDPASMRTIDLDSL